MLWHATVASSAINVDCSSPTRVSSPPLALASACLYEAVFVHKAIISETTICLSVCVLRVCVPRRRRLRICCRSQKQIPAWVWAMRAPIDMSTVTTLFIGNNNMTPSTKTLVLDQAERPLTPVIGIILVVTVAYVIVAEKSAGGVPVVKSASGSAIAIQYPQRTPHHLIRVPLCRCCSRGRLVGGRDG